MSEESHEPTVPPGVGLLAMVTGEQGGRHQYPLAVGRRWPVQTNIPQDVEHAHLLISVHGPADKRAGHLLDTEVPVRWYYAHWVERTDETDGEVTLSPRLLLFRPDGTSVTCSGVAVLEAWSTIVGLFGNKPFEPPITVRIRAIKGGGTHEYHVLSLVPPPKPNTSRKG